VSQLILSIYHPHLVHLTLQKLLYTPIHPLILRTNTHIHSLINSPQHFIQPFFLSSFPHLDHAYLISLHPYPLYPFLIVTTNLVWGILGATKESRQSANRSLCRSVVLRIAVSNPLISYGSNLNISEIFVLRGGCTYSVLSCTIVMIRHCALLYSSECAHYVQSCIPSMHALFTPDICLEIPVSSSKCFLNRIYFSPHHHYLVTRKCTAPPSLRVLRWLLRCV
jgi:hypothetical protein